VTEGVPVLSHRPPTDLGTFFGPETARADLVADNCEQVALLRDSGGCLPEPRWQLCLGVLAFCADGDLKGHEWSSREYANYQHDETQGKLDRWRTMSGPTTCEMFASRFPDGCNGCKFKGKITSPKQLGREGGPQEGIRSSSDYQTDLGNTRRLVARHGTNVRFVPEWRKWIVWDGTRWRIDDDGAIMRFAKETVEALLGEAVKLDDERKRTELVKHALKCQAAARLEAMVSLSTTEAEAVLSAQQLDADPWLLGVQNGVVDLRTGHFREPRREDYITKCTSVPFDPTAACPNWRAFLYTITGGDTELAAYLQRAVGYSLTGLTREEVLFELYGTGNNGKSTWRETLHLMMGDYAIAADAGILIERKTPGGATPELARLKGRRFVAVNETSENDHLNEARVKFITSHDKITARNLYQEFFDFEPTHKTFLTTNHKPIIRGTDTGIWRRIHLLPFTVSIPAERVEKDFRERRLIPELSGILNWALEGLTAYQQQGLNPPAAVRAATQDYQQDMDIVGQWIEDRCVLDPQAIIPTGIAYDDYVRWAQAEIGWVLARLKFRRSLGDRGFRPPKHKGTGGQRLIVGLRLKAPAPLVLAPRIAGVTMGEWR
jgi:putative DNA primase/helicase